MRLFQILLLIVTAAGTLALKAQSHVTEPRIPGFHSSPALKNLPETNPRDSAHFLNINSRLNRNLSKGKVLMIHKDQLRHQEPGMLQSLDHKYTRHPDLTGKTSFLKPKSSLALLTK